MPIQKPAPMMVNGRPIYTLTSYDPVSVEVTVPKTTDEEVELMMGQVLAQHGADPQKLLDAAWIAQEFPGAQSADDLRQAIRMQLEDMSSQNAEQEKPQRCAEELAKRLCQSVPASEVAIVKQDMMAQFEQEARQSGPGYDEFLAANRIAVEQLFEEQAKAVAEQDAALDAFARNAKLEVDTSEYPQLLGIPANQLDPLLEQLRAAGQMASIQEAALRAKAMRVLVSQCKCTYHHETDEEAAERVAQLREMMAQGGQPGGPAEPPAPAGGPSLKLV